MNKIVSQSKKSGSISLMSRVALALIWLYQRTRLLRRPSCRFYPTCSQYTADSIKRFGFLKGLVLGLVRLCKCHPWHDGGVDDVPAKFSLHQVGVCAHVAHDS
ncbi:MAG: membrane protein insertion efficiency factor YidD [Candidatus Obscuribacter sp.]|nr:membrane protein insertion efficiency factor YidD [Candidatus Obscuribacter sp.]MBK7841767.1 membrane protein insertion efficiency factor YidD [Candidatus Obscuribacter sp.]MBK9204498.1 membrane protein insertion efficiency factor YidD [Candidatus Obscuribacter sp.]MBK9622372.1 membrane protein insertion efficiency factor YidD [Candidatus Obscuribacter sp.]MBK9773197.1 membrane protein insertion efficiency factor YidD [Candidatus Obscuribacter sp.]